MTPDQANNIYQSGGPLALAFIAVVLLLFGAMGVIVALVKWQSQNTVPISIYNSACDGFKELSASVDNLLMEIVRGSKR
jgi:hypothetical protein